MRWNCNGKSYRCINFNWINLDDEIVEWKPQNYHRSSSSRPLKFFVLFLITFRLVYSPRFFGFLSISVNEWCFFFLTAKWSCYYFSFVVTVSIQSIPISRSIELSIAALEINQISLKSLSNLQEIDPINCIDKENNCIDLSRQSQWKSQRSNHSNWTQLNN